jgi:hypothetical protein
MTEETKKTLEAYEAKWNEYHSKIPVFHEKKHHLAAMDQKLND